MIHAMTYNVLKTINTITNNFPCTLINIVASLSALFKRKNKSTICLENASNLTNEFI